ncbi:CarD family transcriptional regulator [Tepidibacillus marianensis]|uniref:CarD family transcriptional regulator n=1 Tax=Tepidibacillus marianensis TaxID=3131995 RepID=UPI0030D09C66
MFEIGDKIFYPMHGASIIDSIEEKEVLGEVQSYYIVRIPHKNMQVMIPIGKMNALGIRPIVDSEVLENVFSIFHEGETDLSMNHTQRLRLNLTKLKSGNIYEEAQVIRDLNRMSKQKNLGTEDKFMLDNAKQIFISELVLVKDIAKDQATEILNQVING